MTGVEQVGMTGPAPLDENVMWKKPQRVPKQELDKDAFLQLLVAQMRYQDPSSPMDTTQFMQQTTAMTTVEKLTEMTVATRNNFKMQQQMAAAALNGQMVTWYDDEGGRFSGQVTSVSFANDEATIHVGEQAIPWDRVTQMTASGATPPPDRPAGGPSSDPAAPNAGGTTDQQA